MNIRNTVLFALLCSTSIVFAQLGCGSSTSTSSSVDETWLPCAKDEFRLVGQIGGQSVDIRESTLDSGGGMTQLTTGDFSTQMVSLADDPSRTRLDLQWSKTIDDGATTDATGTLRMPNSGVLASQSYCLGNGTKVHAATDGETLQFKLAGMRGGSGCGAGVTGELQGCWR